MPVPGFELSPDVVEQIMSSETLHAALHEHAAEVVLPAAVGMAGRAGLHDLAASLRVEDGIRPGGRAYAYVVADHDDATRHEFGDTKTARARILGRAAGVKLWPDVEQ